MERKICKTCNKREVVNDLPCHQCRVKLLKPTRKMSDAFLSQGWAFKILCTICKQSIVGPAEDEKRIRENHRIQCEEQFLKEQMAEAIEYL